MDLIQQFPQANSFTIPGKNEAILMIHGFTSTPDIFRPLATRLSETLGWEIQVPLLPGHGLTYQQLNHVTHQEWIYYCEQEFLKLSKRFAKIHLIGLSMGGSLCAYLAMKYPNQTASLILLSPAMYLRHLWDRILLKLTMGFPAFILRRWIMAKKNKEDIEKISYHKFPVRPVLEVQAISKIVFSEFQTSKPCLILVPIHDKTIHPKSATWFFQHAKNPKSKLVELHESPHVVFLGSENEKIFSEILQFLKSI